MNLLHFYSDHRYTSDNDRRRCEIAQSTWLFDVDLAIKDSDLPRLFDDGNGRRIPFIRDLFDFACQGQPDDQIMVFSNTDICFRSNTEEWVSKAMAKVDACYCIRSDFEHLECPLPDWAISLRSTDYGTDAYCFKPRWWKKYREIYPDMLIGRQWWDSIMNIVVDRSQPETAMNVIRWLIYHESHNSFWIENGNNVKLPSQIHNRELARGWFKRNNVDPAPYHL